MPRVLADRDDSPARFPIRGSASRDLIRQSSESLAAASTSSTLDSITVVVPGDADYPLDDSVRVLGFGRVSAAA